MERFSCQLYRELVSVLVHLRTLFRYNAQSMKDLSSWLRLRSKTVRGRLALTVGLGELAGVLLIVQTALLVRIGNGVIFGHETLVSLTPYFGYLLVTILVRSVVAWSSRRAGFACSGSVKHSLREELLQHLGRIGPVTLGGEHAGEIANTAVDAVEALDGYYARYLPQRAIASLLPLTVLAVVFPLDWISGITLLVTAVFIPVMMILIGEDAHERNQKLWGKLSVMSARFLDTLQGVTTLKIFGAAKREGKVIEDISEEYRHSTMSVMRIAFVSALMLELISTVSIAIVAIASGLRMLAGHMPFAPGYFILLIAPEYFLTLRNLGTYYHSRMEAVSAAEHIVRILRIPPEDKNPLGAPARNAAKVAPASLTFRDVGFGYTDERGKVLTDIDLDIAPGEHLFIVGKSGVGKSSLLALVLGFARPTRGRLLIDGSELPLMDREEHLRRISWLPQRPTIFHATVAENIAIGRPGASREEIERAAELAYAGDFIDYLPHGYETQLGERGQGISGGQAQRIALARLFLRDVSLVLLDEPTAHLDPESEARVNESITRLAEGRTLLTVTHRIDNIEASRRVVVLERGRIVGDTTRAAIRRELSESIGEEGLE